MRRSHALIRILLLAILTAPVFAQRVEQDLRELSIVCAQIADTECSRRHLELYREALQLAAGGDAAIAGSEVDG